MTNLYKVKRTNENAKSFECVYDGQRGMIFHKSNIGAPDDVAGICDNKQCNDSYVK